MGNWSNAQFVASQIFVLIGFGFLGLTYLLKNRYAILLDVIAAYIALGFGYFFLHAWVALGMCIVVTIQNISSFYLKGKHAKLDLAMLAAWLATLTIVAAAAQTDIWSWFAYFATVVFLVSTWQKNVTVYKLLGIAVGVLWIVHNIHIENLFGIVAEFVLLAAVAIGLIIHYTEHLFPHYTHGKGFANCPPPSSRPLKTE
jgi:hypothetical protein